MQGKLDAQFEKTTLMDRGHRFDDHRSHQHEEERHRYKQRKGSLDVYSKLWWEESVDTVTRVVEAVMKEPEEKEEEPSASVPKPLLKPANGKL